MADATNVIKDLVGREIRSIWQMDDKIVFNLKPVDRYYSEKVTFYHDQQCCESVDIEDVNGDWKDLYDTPILVAEERVSKGDAEYGTCTYTFYTFRTVKGSVDVRWYGESNGYYSEAVTIKFERLLNMAEI